MALTPEFEYFGAGYETPGFFKDGEGVVHLKGLLRTKVNTTGTAVATLPNGYRPAATEMFIVNARDLAGAGEIVARVDVRADGVVYLAVNVAADNHVSLSGITFRAV
jgi:hypothetical protein